MLDALASDVRAILRADDSYHEHGKLQVRLGAAQLSATSKWARFHVNPLEPDIQLSDAAPCAAWPPVPPALEDEVGRIGRALRSAAALAAARPSLQLMGARAADAPLWARLGSNAAELEEQELVSAELSAGLTDSALAPVEPSMGFQWGVVDDAAAPGGLSLVARLQFAGAGWAAVGFREAVVGSAAESPPADGASTCAGAQCMEGPVWALVALPGAAATQGRVVEVSISNASLAGIVPRTTRDGASVLLERVLVASDTDTAAEGLEVGVAGAEPADANGLAFRLLARRPLVASRGVAGAATLHPGQPAIAVFASGGAAGSLGQLGMHEPGAAGVATVTLRDGPGAGPGGGPGSPVNGGMSDAGAAALTGLAALAVAWLALLPAGIVLAVVAHPMPQGVPRARLLRWHAFCQLGGTAVAIAAGVLPLLESEPSEANTTGVRPGTAVAVAALGAAAVPAINVVLGLCRPRLGAPMRCLWLRLHRAMALVSLALGPIVLSLALSAALAPPGLVGGAAAAATLEVAAVLWLHRSARARPAPLASPLPTRTAKGGKNKSGKRPSAMGMMRNPLGGADTAQVGLNLLGPGRPQPVAASQLVVPEAQAAAGVGSTSPGDRALPRALRAAMARSQGSLQLGSHGAAGVGLLHHPASPSGQLPASECRERTLGPAPVVTLASSAGSAGSLSFLSLRAPSQLQLKRTLSERLAGTGFRSLGAPQDSPRNDG